jgi:hypothetical protein
MPISTGSSAESEFRTMTSTRFIAVGVGALAVGLFASGVDRLAASVQTARSDPTPVAAVTPQVTATPQATVASQADAKPSAVAPAKADEGARGTQPGAVREDDKPLVVFFSIRDRACSVAYVIDRSGSMASHDSLRVAKRELLTSLDPLPADVQFAVILYNMEARTLCDDQGHAGLMAATASNRKRVQSQVAGIEPDGGTDHVTALHAALSLKPEVLFFLTDADLMTNGDVDEILEGMGKSPKQGVGTGRGFMAGFRVLVNGFSRPPEVQKTRIQVIEFGRGPELNQTAPLRRLAGTTDGSYVYFDVTKFSR